MLWLIYEDYFKQNVRTTSFVRYLKWHIWGIFILFTIGTLIFLITFFKSNNGFFLLGVYICAGISGVYLGNELKKTILTNVGDTTDVFDNDMISIRNILLQRNINKIEQIDLLINQINEEIPDLKLSEKFLKSIYTISTALLIPILSLLIKWFLDFKDEGIFIVGAVVTLCLMFLGLYFLIKPSAEQILDSSYRKMWILKRKLEDVKLLDFLQ
ncbi:hypothetical protein [Rummeliibacillus stabekisii]|uniref:hypothetical protein n=1 Tax=Rummeliibacillus stabekisii TaxID=241244 RepID=UPI00372185B4